MRQSARHIYVPHGNKVYVNNWRAWRIRRRTINNHSKTDMFNRVFVYGWFIVRQGGIAPTTKFKPLIKSGFNFVFKAGSKGSARAKRMPAEYVKEFEQQEQIVLHTHTQQKD